MKRNRITSSILFLIILQRNLNQNRMRENITLNKHTNNQPSFRRGQGWDLVGSKVLCSVTVQSDSGNTCGTWLIRPGIVFHKPLWKFVDWLRIGKDGWSKKERKKHTVENDPGRKYPKVPRSIHQYPADMGITNWRGCHPSLH